MQTASFPHTDRTVSRLGFGCMRFPTLEKDGKKVIDRPQAIAMLRHAIDSGVTYIDTAYPYHDRESETVVGLALQGGYRDRVTLTTKLPLWLLETKADMQRFLDEQLTKLKTDHVDFYLLHAMDKEALEKMRKLDYPEFLEKAVKAGKVRYPGFSFHDDYKTFVEILNDYDWKLAQVQMNVLDGDNQATLQGIRDAGKKGVGVVIMEPLRGGALAHPPKEAAALYEAFPEKRSAVEWAFRYLYDMPEVVTILSGMSTMEQLDDNLRIFAHAEKTCMNDTEKKLIADVKAAYLSRMKTGCTGCRYCQPCPRNVHIPDIFHAWDESLMFDRPETLKRSMARRQENKEDPSQCVACGKCEKACPQHLPIVKLLKEADQAAKA